MNMWSAGGLLALMLLAFRALLVSDVADGYLDCQEAMLRMTERPSMPYPEQKALQKQAEAVCHGAQVRAKLTQAVLAPSTLRD